MNCCFSWLQLEFQLEKSRFSLKAFFWGGESVDSRFRVIRDSGLPNYIELISFHGFCESHVLISRCCDILKAAHVLLVVILS